ncbi:LON peptidase substrate-binding domain-containing protein [Pseudoalteromonas phenolica]|uniref:LON peptidase substrate-binding domain-containing protein n=1 Tax=Pseudoalteromonas phenolica TaxID=161398 RepID=UPI00110B49F4|nr:LON peptidase substrate-binding domain-containing protein [Pseudoalteromonas phenolica]TMO56385.1 hypothetical protein CWC21_06715 [Pseudoalteromonas phenolica]
MQLPVFPLPVFLLPEGVTRLRIFEPRYKKLVSIATKEDGFALTIYKPDAEFEVSEWAAWVNIVDFFEEEGMLHIDVQAKSLVKLSNVYFDEDNLRFAKCEPKEHWAQASSSENHIALADKLEEIFSLHPDIKNLYPAPQFDNPNWVCARYLELLPLSMEQKEVFVDQYSFDKAQNFLHTIMLG